MSHFPCCITNFPQGWPKFTQHTFVTTDGGSTVVVASLVPSVLKLASAQVVVVGSYPFADGASVECKSSNALKLQIRIPAWARHATLNGKPASNGTLPAVDS